jgi:hypothetical protein
MIKIVQYVNNVFYMIELNCKNLNLKSLQFYFKIKKIIRNYVLIIYNKNITIKSHQFSK